MIATAEPTVRIQQIDCPVEEPKQEKDRATGWIHKLNANAPELSAVRDALIGSRAAMMDTVRDLGLPHIPYSYGKVDEFLKNPATLTEGLKGDQFFFIIQPTDYAANIEAPSPGIASLGAIIDRAKEFTKAATGNDFTLVLSEVKDIEFIGNIVVDANGRMYGEFTDEGIPPTRSGVTRLFSFKKDDILDTFRYSFENPELRKAIFQSLSSLPHIGTGRERVWDKGYYELHFIRSQDGPLTPAFYDYRISNAFLFVPPTPPPTESM
jgi:hypothetical protein